MISARLEKLERTNRTLKRGGLGLLLLLCAVLTMGQTRPVPQAIEAQQFVVKDPQGHIRATLGFSGGAPQLRLYDDRATLRASLIVGANGAPGISLYDPAGNQTVGLASLDGGPSLALTQGAQRLLSLQEVSKQPDIILGVNKKDGTVIMAGDAEGFYTTIGNTDLVTPRTGEKHRSSAASLALFDKDGSVIWSAP